MITIFSTPKPFAGKIKTIQENAIGSWAALHSECEIILFGEEEGTAEACKQYGIRHVREIARNEYGTPLVSDMFRTAQELARHEVVCYANADIILLGDFLQAIKRIEMPRFLVVGQRWDVDIEEPLDFESAGWRDELLHRAKIVGKLHGETGIDYFVFPRGQYVDIPPLAVGRPGWDNWMIYHTRSRRIPVIDATRAITAIHQNHGHADFRGGEKGFWSGPEAENNLRIAGGVDRVFHIGFADWTMDGKGLRRAHSLRSCFYRVRAFPALHQKLGFLMPLVKLPGRIAGVLRRA